MEEEGATRYSSKKTAVKHHGGKNVEYVDGNMAFLFVSRVCLRNLMISSSLRHMLLVFHELFTESVSVAF